LTIFYKYIIFSDDRKIIVQMDAFLSLSL